LFIIKRFLRDTFNYSAFVRLDYKTFLFALILLQTLSFFVSRLIIQQQSANIFSFYLPSFYFFFLVSTLAIWLRL